MLLFLRKGLYFDQNDGGGSAATTGNSTDDSAGAAGNGDQAKSDADQAGDEKDKGKQTSKVTFTAEQQAEVDQIVKDRLARAQKKAEAETEKARKQAEEDGLKKNQEFEKLAETRQSKISEFETQLAELTPFKELAEKYKGAMEKMLQAQIEKLPKTIKVLIEKMDPLDQMQYLTENAKELNIDIKGVPETDTNDSTNKLNQEALNKAKQNNAKMVKTFLGG